MKQIFALLILLATFAIAQTDSTDILITIREDGDTTAVGRWRAGMPVIIRDSWDGWGSREKLPNKFVIIRSGISKAMIDSFLVAHYDSTTGLRRKYQLSRAAIQFVKNNRDANNLVRVTPAQLRNAFKRANRLRRFSEPQRMGMISEQQFIRWRNMLIGATATSATVNTDGGGDYTSLAAAEAGEQKDLETANEQLTINCSGTTSDVTAVVFDGWTTDATRLIIIQGDQNSGVIDNTKYRLIVGAAQTGIVIQNCNIIVKNTAIISNGLQNILQNGNYQCVFYNNILKGGGSDALSFTTTNAFVVNNVIYNAAGAGIRVQTGDQNIYLYNNTVYGCGIGINFNFATDNTAINNLLINNSQDYRNNVPGATFNSAANITSDTTSPDGASYQSLTVNFADAANSDFRLLAGSPGIDQGVDLSSDPSYPFNTAIDGTIRPQGAAWDIGAFEYVQPATTNNDKKSRFHGFGRGFNGGWKK